MALFALAHAVAGTILATWILPDSLGRLLGFGAIAGFLSCVVMSFYLLISSSVFGRHHNEAFSALATTKWKNFLRIRVDAEGMHIHAIGMDSLPDHGEEPTAHQIEYRFLKH